MYCVLHIEDRFAKILLDLHGDLRGPSDFQFLDFSHCNCCNLAISWPIWTNEVSIQFLGWVLTFGQKIFKIEHFFSVSSKPIRLSDTLKEPQYPWAETGWSGFFDFFRFWGFFFQKSAKKYFLRFFRKKFQKTKNPLLTVSAHGYCGSFKVSLSLIGWELTEKKMFN